MQELLNIVILGADQQDSNDVSLPLLNLSGYKQVDPSNVTFTPTPGSLLTIWTPVTIAASSSTKTITQVLLLQNVTDPTDTPFYYSTEAPFSIDYTPTRMGPPTSWRSWSLTT